MKHHFWRLKPALQAMCLVALLPLAACVCPQGVPSCSSDTATCQPDSTSGKEFLEVEVLPQMIGGMQALYSRVQYPELAVRAGVTGMATVHFIVGVDGLPRDYEVVVEKPDGLGFGAAAIDALSKTRFLPGQAGGKQVPVLMTQTIRFDLRSAVSG